MNALTRFQVFSYIYINILPLPGREAMSEEASQE